MDKIVQADRDEAARTGLAIGLLSGVDALNVQQGGVWDEWNLVQAFARHRLSHTPQSVEPVAIHVAALVETAYREGWRAGLASERPCSPYRTDDDDWADSDAFAALAPFTEGQNDGQ